MDNTQSAGYNGFSEKKWMKNKHKKSAATQLSVLFIRDDISISLQIIWHFPDCSNASYINYKPTNKKSTEK